MTQHLGSVPSLANLDWLPVRHNKRILPFPIRAVIFKKWEPVATLAEFSHSITYTGVPILSSSAKMHLLSSSLPTSLLAVGRTESRGGRKYHVHQATEPQLGPDTLYIF